MLWRIMLAEPPVRPRPGPGPPSGRQVVECVPQARRPVIRLRLPREAPVPHVVSERRHRLGRQPPQVGVLAHELRHRPSAPRAPAGRERPAPARRTTGPAPMPIVGTSSASVAAAPTTSGTPSSTKPKHPAASSAFAASSKAVAASTDLPCTRNPPMASTDCGVRPKCPITGISARMIASTTPQPGPPALELDGLRAGPHERRRVAHRLLGGGVVAHPRHVAEDQRAGLAPGPPPPCGAPSRRCRRAACPRSRARCSPPSPRPR